MNAVWIALLGVFVALVPVFVLAAKKSQTTKAAPAPHRDDGMTAVLAAAATAHGAIPEHPDHGGGSDGGGDGGG